MRPKVRCTFYLSRRLYRILEEISPLFMDYETEDPKRGAMTKALEYILQRYMETEDYRSKVRARKELAKRFYDLLVEKDKEFLTKTVKRMMEKENKKD